MERAPARGVEDEEPRGDDRSAQQSDEESFPNGRVFPHVHHGSRAWLK
jgi:hypothetical protein